MRLPLIAIAACVLCALVGFAVGYFYGFSAARRASSQDPSNWENRKPPSAVD
jgi:membrane protein YqaA with SNARE-associated domain